jgi:hypothetical protein
LENVQTSPEIMYDSLEIESDLLEKVFELLENAQPSPEIMYDSLGKWFCLPEFMFVSKEILHASLKILYDPFYPCFFFWKYLPAFHKDCMVEKSFGARPLKKSNLK